MVSITPLCSMQYLAICNRVLFAHYKCILYVLLGASQGEWVQGVQEARVQGDHQAGVQDCSKASKWHHHNHSPHHHHHDQNLIYHDQGLPHCDGASAKRGVCSGHKERMQRGIIINFILRMISDSKSWIYRQDYHWLWPIIRSAEKCARTLLRMSEYVCFYYFQIKH